MNTVNADQVRIPRGARDAVARHELVVVLNRERPVLVLSHPDDRPSSQRARRGRPLRDALAMLSAAPLPDDAFGRDLAAVQESVGPVPPDPWAHS